MIIKKTITSCWILLGIISPITAQIYTPSGTIQGSSGNNNVGIGTTTPDSKLTVNGNAKIKDNLLVSDIV